MKRRIAPRQISSYVFAALLLLIPASFDAAPTAPVIQPNVGVNGFFSVDKAQRGRVVQAAVVVDIPHGYHINANRLIGKIGVPTTLKIEAPGGIKISPIAYPRPLVRKLKFSDDQLALYEGRAVMRFSITIPANYEQGLTELRARVRYQSCNEELCFPPTTREVRMPIGIVGANESVKRINANLFGSAKRRG
ncbi:MAG TPA: protein-disulfide reductase DsbD N-terminal domain-containing protein [Pyrinomonadaceae bacterium]|jgi:DsbC/DsbD-like thiol-disulfide interchange protein